MSAGEVILIVIVLVLAAVVALLLFDRRRSRRLRSRFGPEYVHTLSQVGGDRRRAERELARREKRLEELSIRPLSTGDRERFASAWREEQARFVDDPTAALAGAGRLVQEVMEARHYPVADFEQRIEDISVDHPRVVQNYRAALDIARRHDQRQATTEDLRKALVHYRELFEELLEERAVTG